VLYSWPFCALFLAFAWVGGAQVKFASRGPAAAAPRSPLKLLHGRMKQMPRLAVFHDFCDASHAALLATDVAARGLDFPTVDWVVQVRPPPTATAFHPPPPSPPFHTKQCTPYLVYPGCAS